MRALSATSAQYADSAKAADTLTNFDPSVLGFAVNDLHYIDIDGV